MVRMNAVVSPLAFLPEPCLAPFQIGDLVFARRFEHAIARVPIGLQRDVVEMPVRQSADYRLHLRTEMQ